MGHINLSIPDRIGIVIENPNYLDSFRLHARETLQQVGHLPDTPLWQYLHWRRALAPARFDRFHPEFRKLFRDESRHHPAIPVMPVLPELPITGLSPVVVQPPIQPMMPSVAEPSSGVLLGLSLVVALLWWAVRGGGR